MSLPCGTFDQSYEQDIAIVRTKLQWFLLIAFIGLLFIIPFLLSEYIVSVFIYILIWLPVALGLSILTGYCGQFSIGQAAFMAVGGFSSALLVDRYGFSFWAALPCAGIIAGLVGVLFGAPSFRVKGFYLALSTLAAQFIIIYVLVHFFSGDTGVHVPAPTLGSIEFDNDQSYYYIVLVVAIIMTFFAKNIGRTRIGRSFIAIRDNEPAAEAMGINLYAHKLLAFFIGCFFAGIGGALIVFYIGAALTPFFTLYDSIWFLGMIIIGGMGSITGTILGVCFVKGLFELSYYIGEASGITVALPEVFFGVVLLLFLIIEPRGLYHLWEMFKTSYRLHPFPY